MSNLNVIQYDTAREIHFYFDDDYTIPPESEIRIYIKKPSGLEIYNHCLLDNNEIIVYPTTQMFAECGANIGQIQIIKNNKILTCFVFNINVEESCAENAIPSTNEFTILDALIIEARKIIAEENARIEAENIRIENENNRISNENNRVEAENDRISSENDRVEAENTRIENEAQRQQNTNTAIENCNRAVANIQVKVTEAENHANSAKDYSLKSKSYAEGTDGEIRPNDNSECAKFYYEQSKRIAQGVSGIVPMGTITFAELSLPENQVSKYMFDISDDFISDERFKNGSGIHYGAGSNVIRTGDGMWDVLAATSVTGVKGDKESVYRQGFVNLTPEDIGAATVDDLKGINADFIGTKSEMQTKIASGELTNGMTVYLTDGGKKGTIFDSKIIFDEAQERQNIQSGESIKTLCGKVKKWFSDLKAVAFTGSYNDLINKPTLPTNMTAASASTAGKAGLVPAPSAGAQVKYLRGDGTWQIPPDTNTTYGVATTTANGLMSATDKTKLNGIATGANAYSLPLASASVRGGAKIGYSGDNTNLPVKLSSEKMYVSLPHSLGKVSIPVTVNSNWTGSVYLYQIDTYIYWIYLHLTAKANIADGNHVLFYPTNSATKLASSNSYMFRIEFWKNSVTTGRYFEVIQATYQSSDNKIYAVDYQVKKGDEYFYNGCTSL